MGAVEAASNEVARLLQQAATAVERAAEMLLMQLNTPSMFVSPPGKLYCGRALQQFVYMRTEV